MHSSKVLLAGRALAIVILLVVAVWLVGRPPIPVPAPNGGDVLVWLLAQEAWPLAWREKTSVLSLAGIAAVPFALLIKLIRNGWPEMRAHLVKHLLESVIPASLGLLCIFAWKVFITVPERIRTDAAAVSVPSLPKPPGGPLKVPKELGTIPVKKAPIRQGRGFAGTYVSNPSVYYIEPDENIKTELAERLAIFRKKYQERTINVMLAPDVGSSQRQAVARFIGSALSAYKLGFFSATNTFYGNFTEHPITLICAPTDRPIAEDLLKALTVYIPFGVVETNERFPVSGYTMELYIAGTPTFESNGYAIIR